MKLIFVFGLVLCLTNYAHAWGKRGHEMVGSLAAQLLSQENPQAAFLSSHSFDMGYYNNAPDLVWKANPETYKKEFSQHFIDLEIFEKTFKEKKENSPWNSNRAEFFKKFPQFENHAGRAPWRIEEFNIKLTEITKKLKNKNLFKKDRHKLQEEWLVMAGLMGHYIADLAQPMHVSENHDGQLTNQKGLHHWFEEDVIDALYPSLNQDVLQRARKQWKDFSGKNKKLSAFQLALNLAQNSHESVAKLLAIDKKNGRSSATKIAEHYRELSIERLSMGVLYLAILWSEQLDWSYDGDHFFNFVTTPTYIEPGT